MVSVRMRRERPFYIPALALLALKYTEVSLRKAHSCLEVLL